MKNQNQRQKKRNENLLKYHLDNPSLAMTTLARIFHLSNTRVRKIIERELAIIKKSASEKK